jgi:multiple sugar transport system permease protein
VFRPDVLAQAFMITATVLWLIPVLFALYVALRPYGETSKYGYVSLPHHLTLSNFVNAWTQPGMWQFFLNSVWITVPAVLVTLFLAPAASFFLACFGRLGLSRRREHRL